MPRGYRDLLGHGRVFVTNWHAFGVKDDTNKRGVVQRGRESDAAFVRRVLGKDLGSSQQLLVLNDEAHHAYRPAPPKAEEEEQTELAGLSSDERREAEEISRRRRRSGWGGLDRINKVRGIKMMIDALRDPLLHQRDRLPGVARPFHGLCQTSGSSTPSRAASRRCLVSRWPMTLAGLTRSTSTCGARSCDVFPQGERETNKRRAKPEAVWRGGGRGRSICSPASGRRLREHFEASGFRVPPVIIVVA